MASKNVKDRCVFCGRPDTEVPYLLKGLTGSICPDCVRLAKEYVDEVEGQASAGWVWRPGHRHCLLRKSQGLWGQRRSRWSLRCRWRPGTRS